MSSALPKPPADGPKSGATVHFSAHRRGEWDRQIAHIAERQHGLVSLGQLGALGIDRSTAQKRVEAGRLHRIYQGVFAVRHRLLTREGRLMAAVLACGSGAMLSHRSAAELWRLREAQGGPIDVTAAHRRGREPYGIRSHRDGSVLAVDGTTVDGIPCTTVPRTLLDMASVVSVWELRKALSEAEVLRLLDHDALRSLIKRSRGRRGVARLRMLLDEIHPDTKRTRSEMERRFLRMCDRAGLPPPEVNVPVDVGNGHLTPDFLWRDGGLIMEADSRLYHGTNSAFQRDRRREQRLQLAGWRVSRCTWEQIDREPHDLAATIRGLLTQSKPGSMGRNVEPQSTFRPIGG